MTIIAPGILYVGLDSSVMLTGYSLHEMVTNFPSNKENSMIGVMKQIRCVMLHSHIGYIKRIYKYA